MISPRSVQAHLSLLSTQRTTKNIESSILEIKQSVQILLDARCTLKRSSTDPLPLLEDTAAICGDTLPSRPRSQSLSSTDQLLSLYAGSCISWCPCRCHRQHYQMIAAGASSLLGIFFICLSGGRFTLLSCNNTRCKRKQPLTLKMAFVFPPWLLSWAFYLVLSMQSLSEKPRFQKR